MCFLFIYLFLFFFWKLLLIFLFLSFLKLNKKRNILVRLFIFFFYMSPKYEIPNMKLNFNKLIFSSQIHCVHILRCHSFLCCFSSFFFLHWVCFVFFLFHFSISFTSHKRKIYYKYIFILLLHISSFLFLYSWFVIHKLTCRCVYLCFENKNRPQIRNIFFSLFSLMFKNRHYFLLALATNCHLKTYFALLRSQHFNCHFLNDKILYQKHWNLRTLSLCFVLFVCLLFVFFFALLSIRWKFSSNIK